MPRHQGGPTRDDEGARLKRLREALSMSQRDLAKEFQVTAAAIAQWEGGQRTVPGSVLRLMELYEEELPGRAAEPLGDSGISEMTWAKRTALSSFSTFSWVVARGLFGSAPRGSIRRRIRKHAMESYVETSSRLRGLSLKWAQLAWTLQPLATAHAMD